MYEHEDRCWALYRLNCLWKIPYIRRIGSTYEYIKETDPDIPELKAGDEEYREDKEEPASSSGEAHIVHEKREEK